MLSQSRITEGVATTARHGTLRILLKKALLITAIGLPALPLHAQDQPINFDLLVFDPVPITIQAAQAAATPEAAQSTRYQASELATLPRNNPQPVSLLVQRYSNPGISERSGTTAPDDAARYEAMLKELEQKGDAYDLELTETLMSLASAYENTGDFARALPLYERASHITRVNHGLFSGEQIPIVERVIDNQIARGDLLAANQQQDYLYYLNRRIYGDNNPALLPALLRYAEWNVHAFLTRMLSPPPPVSLDEATDTTPSSTEAPAPVEDIVNFRIQRLINAQIAYEEAINLMLAHFGPGDSRLPSAERSLAVASYLYATQVVLYDSSQSDNSLFFSSDMPVKMLGFTEGRQALERRVQYLQDAPNSSRDEITLAKLELGDWLISSRKRMNAIELYDQIFADYIAAGASQAEIDAIFYPRIPVSIPTFVISPYTRQSLSIPADVALQYKGYVDVEFVVGRYGQSSMPRELARSPDTSDKLVDTLMRSIRRDQFRPRYRDGRVVEEDRVQARYYYAY